MPGPMKALHICRLAPGFVASLVKFDPKTASAPEGIKWQNHEIIPKGLQLPEENGIRRSAFFPCVVKSRLDQPAPDSSALYCCQIYIRKGENGPGETRKTMNHLEIRLYPFKGTWPNGEEFEPAILDFFSWSHANGQDQGEQLQFLGKSQPLHTFRLVGWEVKGADKHYINGAIFFVPKGAVCTPYTVEAKTETTWGGPALIQLPFDGGEQMMTCRKYIGFGGAGTIYDHRPDRLAPFGTVEKIRKTVGGRSFEFYNIREFNGTPETVKHIITESGVQGIEEEEAA